MKIDRQGATQAAVTTLQTDVTSILADTDDLQLRNRNVVRKTITFTGGAGLGAVGAVPLFTTTGRVHIERLMPYCTVDLVGATATLALGVTGSTAIFIAATTATDLDAADFWVDTAPDPAAVALPAALKEIMIDANIIGTVATADITGGAILFTAHWWPISAGATLVAAA